MISNLRLILYNFNLHLTYIYLSDRYFALSLDYIQLALFHRCRFRYAFLDLDCIHFLHPDNTLYHDEICFP